MFAFDFTEELIKWQGDKAAWHFILLPSDLSHEISRLCSDRKGGWGSIKVRATIGTTTWQTSIFPSKQADAYLLPIKAEVRTAEQIAEGDDVPVTLSI
jgi:hypothetical protein